MTDTGDANSDVRLIDAVDERVSSVRTRQLDLSFNELADMYSSERTNNSPRVSAALQMEHRGAIKIQ